MHKVGLKPVRRSWIPADEVRGARVPNQVRAPHGHSPHDAFEATGEGPAGIDLTGSPADLQKLVQTLKAIEQLIQKPGGTAELQKLLPSSKNLDSSDIEMILEYLKALESLVEQRAAHNGAMVTEGTPPDATDSPGGPSSSSSAVPRANSGQSSQDSSSAPADATAVAGNEAAALNAYKPGDWGGQCCAFVEKIFGLEGKGQEFGLNSVGNGGVTVDGLERNYGFKASGPVPGSVFEGNFEGGGGPGHTGVVLKNLGNGKLLIEDSNWNGDEKVHVHVIDIHSSATPMKFCVKP